ncbi:MAG: YchJ family protein [Desulfuromonadaceae bacterium]|nr:YchJ family protein [Desulfuromonadaceae bacterium]MDD2847403.1 YchJ family protein [Desulfuromonadaceae bacterium]MDD4131484.1 YchJ family protein [Desulfuromonadaceae bacterium]
MTTCPCGSGTLYSECCEQIISGKQSAQTAEQLMRARYSAYVFAKMDFIFESTHPDHREGYDHAGTKTWAETAEWQGLEIISTNKGEAGDSIGEVEFIARFSENGNKREHHEAGQFKQKDGQWYFSEGLMVRPKPLTVTKVGRNDPCTCGSGLKYKKCCGK